MVAQILEGDINDEFVPSGPDITLKITCNQDLVGVDSISKVPTISLQLNMYTLDGAFIQFIADPCNVALETTGSSVWDNVCSICYFPYAGQATTYPSLGNFIYSSPTGFINGNPKLDMSSFFHPGGEIDMSIHGTSNPDGTYSVETFTVTCSGKSAVIDLTKDPLLSKYPIMFSKAAMPSAAYGIMSQYGVLEPPPYPMYGWYRNGVSPLSLDMVGEGAASSVFDTAGAGQIEYKGVVATGRIASYMTAENSNDYYSPPVSDPVNAVYLQNWQATKIPITPVVKPTTPPVPVVNPPTPVIPPVVVPPAPVVMPIPVVTPSTPVVPSVPKSASPSIWSRIWAFLKRLFPGL